MLHPNPCVGGFTPSSSIQEAHASGWVPAPPDLRRRIAGRGLSSLADQELLEFCLARTDAGEASAAAERALGRFGSFAAACSAALPQLEPVVGRAAALDLNLLHEIAVRLSHAQLPRRDLLTSQSAVCAYLKVLLAGQPREQVWVLYLDKKNQLLLSEMMSEGTIDHAPVYPREVVRRALEVNAAALILVHNHPSGDPTPSQADITMTAEVVAAAKALKIAVHDHMVVGREGLASMRSLGLI